MTSAPNAVVDVLGTPVTAGDTIACAFAEFGNPTLRVGTIVSITRARPRPSSDDQSPVVHLNVHWTAGSAYALIPSQATTRIDASLRRFIRIDHADAVVVPEAGPRQMTLEELT